MIRLSKIDDKLSIYRGKKIILFGAGKGGEYVKMSLENEGFEIAYFCDNDKTKWGRRLDNYEIISPAQLCSLYNENILIQISTSRFNSEIEKQLREFGFEFITFLEYIERMHCLCKYKLLPQAMPCYMDLLSESNYFIGKIKEESLDYAVRVKYFGFDSYNILCMPPKTGNTTLNASIQKCGCEYIDFVHSFERMSGQLEKLIEGVNVKIITAVRDPIAQNISLFFEINELFCDVFEYWKDGGDVQVLFDSWISLELENDLQFHRKSIQNKHQIMFQYFEYIKKLTGYRYNIQKFFDNKFENVNIYNYPFDKKKGYSIIHAGKYEIFIYQLEKLNDIKDELGEFLGVDKFELINDNVGAEKWYAQVYKHALQKLRLSKEYYEYCYESKFVKHFYSEEDISQFRRRWKQNIDE